MSWLWTDRKRCEIIEENSVELEQKLEAVSEEVQNKHIGMTTAVRKLDERIEVAMMGLAGKVGASSREAQISWDQIRRDH